MSTDRKAHRKAFVLMIIAPVLWSMAGIFTRHLEAARSFEVTFWRSLVAALFVAGTLYWQRRSGAVAAMRKAGWLGLMSGLMWASMFSAFMLALTMTTVANTLIVNSISPFLTVLLAWIFLGEKATTRTWAVIALAFVGMVWMFADSMTALDGRHLVGMSLALVVPFAASVNFIVLRKAGKQIEMIPSVFLGGIFSALAMLPLAWPLQASMHDIAIMALLGVFQLGLPCMLMVRAANHLSPAEVSLLALLEVLLGPFWVWLGVGEVPSQATLIGGSIVLLALILHEVMPTRQPQKAKQLAPERTE